MGAIQNSLNSIAQSIESAVKTGVAISEYGARQGEAFEEAKMHKAQAEGEMKELEVDQIAAEAELNKATKALARTKEGSATNKKRMTEVEAAQLAFDALSDKIEARKAMISRAEKVMKRTSTWGGMK